MSNKRQRYAYKQKLSELIMVSFITKNNDKFDKLFYCFKSLSEDGEYEEFKLIETIKEPIEEVKPIEKIKPNEDILELQKRLQKKNELKTE